MMLTGQKSKFTFVLITVFIESVGLGIMLPVMPRLLVELGGGDIGDAAAYGGILIFVYALMQFIFAPLLGRLSDHFGRRPIILLAMLIFAFNNLMMTIATSITWLLVARTISGIAGATSAVANTVAFDISSREKRAETLGMISAAGFIGVFAGPVMGGFLVDFGSRMPFLVSAVLALANFLFGLIVLPETLKPENRRQFTFKITRPVGQLFKFEQIGFMLPLLFAYFILSFAYDTNFSVLGYYTMEKYLWTERQLGYFLSFLSGMLVLIQGLIIKIAVPRLGEKRVIIWGMILNIVGFTGFAFAPNGWALILFSVPFCVGCLAAPAFYSLLSQKTPNDQQGALNGNMNSMAAASGVLSPLIMTQTFKYFTSEKAVIYFPGFPFLVAAVCIVLALLFTVVNFKRSY
ncbi:MFS transporter [Gynuella sunshinyii]|uniref:Arabinose efflux permease n=1 Tax=Gynuella sunshinyii YC6258 TaxID=1445510 RepID=A0A0C5VLV8_9GAMM|nr:MFS transporter [Gynuella sunshinyii]AJQ95702.1 arabinose efflux permease [Gynuella sunshinyii YC6258]